MQKVITIESSGRSILIDTDLVTVKSRGEIRKKLIVPPAMKLKQSHELLREIGEKFRSVKPTDMEVKQAFLSMLDLNSEENKPESDDVQTKLEEEICRICCRWLDGKGKKAKPGDVLTEEEFGALPYDAGVFIANMVFNVNAKGFLVDPPQSK